MNRRYQLLTCKSDPAPRPHPGRPQEQAAFPPLKVDYSRPTAVPQSLLSVKGLLKIVVVACIMAQDVPVIMSMTTKLYVELLEVESGVYFLVGGMLTRGLVGRD